MAALPFAALAQQPGDKAGKSDWEVMLGANVLTLQGPRPGDGRCQLGQDAGIQTPRSPSIDAVRLAP